jgi:anaerobic magnesium-protoporphyrin IX monomethyl ester cyclase
MRMNVSLVYTPFVWPASPPLGVALLKSYVESAVPGTMVSALDLNVELFKSPGKRVRSLCKGCPRRLTGVCMPPEAYLEGSLYEQARAFFSNAGDDFYDPRQHAENYLFFRTFYEQIQECYKTIFDESFKSNKECSKTAGRLVAADGRRIIAQKPDLVGFSAQNDQAAYTLALARWIKQNSSASVVIGGYFPSFCDPKEILQAFPFVDSLVIQEGELPLAGIIRQMEGKTKKNPPGTVRMVRGKIVRTACEPVRDLDSLPFADFSDFDPDDYWSPYPVLPVIASRGCPWARCAFCSHRENYHSDYRQRSAQNVADELLRQKSATGTRHFLFCDEQINGPRLEELSAAISGADIIFGLAGLKPDRTISRKRLKAAHAAGCRWVYLGVESFSQRVLNLIDKGTRVDDILNVIRDCLEAGITPFVSYMWGFPTQTRSEVDSEKKIIEQNSEVFLIPDDGHPFVLTKNSPVWKNPEKYKIKILEPEILLSADTGKVHSGHYSFEPLTGLTPFLARSIYRRLQITNYETHSFWESMLLLADKRIILDFNRSVFLNVIADSPFRRLAVAMKSASPGKPNSLFERALCLEIIYELKEAERIYKKLKLSKIAIRQYPQIEYRLGAIHEKKSQYKKAIECYNSALRVSKLDRDIALILFHIAECEQMMDRHEASSGHYKKVLNITSSNETYVSAAIKLGFCLERMHMYREAVETYQRARDLDHEGRNVMTISFYLTGCYEALGETDAIIEETKILKDIL